MSLVDMRIDVDDYLPKMAVGYCGSTSSKLPPFMVINGRYRNSSFSYTMLPEEPLKLSVLKLDGSSFEIEVMKSATIGELRQAVEAVFSHMPQKGPGKISWPHVWSHFCLIFDGRKLVIETDNIRNYGIRDGDQLQFIRHISTSYTIRKKRSMKQIIVPEQHTISMAHPDTDEEKEHDDKEGNSFDVENGVYNDYYDTDFFVNRESKWAGLYQRLFPYSKLQSAERSLKGSPSRSASGILSSVRKIIQFCGDRHHS